MGGGPCTVTGAASKMARCTCGDGFFGPGVFARCSLRLRGKRGVGTVINFRDRLFGRHSVATGRGGVVSNVPALGAAASGTHTDNNCRR